MKYQVIRGFQFPLPPRFKKENIEETLDYVPHDDDIIVASYPKTGTTWLGYIILQIVSKGERFPDMNESDKHIPFLEMTGSSAIEAMEGPRIYKHHYPYNMVPKNPKAKYVYIYRNPADVAVSFYHFTKGDSPGTFDEFFEEFLTGDIPYGLYFEHVLSYLKHKDDKGLLLVSYEKLHVNRKEEILRIAKFLGEDYFKGLLENESILEKIIERTSFDYMKKHLKLMRPGSKDAQPKDMNFFRKGTVGDGQNSLSPDQMKRLKEVMVDTVQGTDLTYEWSN